MNPAAAGGVWLIKGKRDGRERMHERESWAVSGFVKVDTELEREFEARLVDTSTLAFRVAYSVLRHREDAEDVAQEAFAKAYRNFRQLRNHDAFRGWLVRMTWRLALDRQRSNRRRAMRETDYIDRSQPAPTTIEEITARERAVRVWEAIDALPEKLRLVIVLTGIEGHDLREVAGLLGLPEGTVKSRLFLARQRLKEQLRWTRPDPSR